MNVDFTDIGAKWLLELEHGVLQYYQDQQKSDADVTLSLAATDFIEIAEGKTTIDKAVKAGVIKLTGSQAKLDEFLSYFITFDAWYHVVTPVEPK